MGIIIFKVYIKLQSYTLCLKREKQTDDSDVWRLEIAGGKKGEILGIVEKSFQLISTTHKCVLTTTGKTYPEWGFGAGEVACHPKLHDDRSYWHVDENNYPRCKFPDL